MNMVQDNSSLPTNPFVRLAQPQEMLYVVLVVSSIGKTYFQSPCSGTLLRSDLVLTTVSCLLLEPGSSPDPNTIDVCCKFICSFVRYFHRFLCYETLIIKNFTLQLANSTLNVIFKCIWYWQICYTL